MRIIFLAVTILITGLLKAQTAEDSVKAAVNNLFAAMRASNGETIKSCFTDSALLQTIALDKGGKTLIRNESIRDFALQISKLPKDSADERITFDVVKRDGPLAIVWTPYRFYYAGKFSHCGVNSFQLVRIEGSWKIQYLIDTRRKNSCE